VVEVVSEVGRQAIPFLPRDPCRKFLEDLFDGTLRWGLAGTGAGFSTEAVQDFPGGPDLVRWQAVHKPVQLFFPGHRNPPG